MNCSKETVDRNEKQIHFVAYASINYVVSIKSFKNTDVKWIPMMPIAKLVCYFTKY